MAIHRILLYGVTMLAVLAPLPFGAVEEHWSAALVFVSLGLGVLWLAWRSRRGLPALPLREPLLVAAALLAGAVLLQLLPMPAAALEVLSPRAAGLRAELMPPEGASGAWSPLSMYPWATRQALLRFVSYALIALITMDLASAVRARQVLVGALVAGGAFQAAYGLGEFLSGRQQIFGYVKQHYLEMATGTFINKNHYAGYLAMLLPVTLALAVAAFPRSAAPERLSFLRKVAALPGREMFRAVMVLLLAVLMGTAVIASRSRAGIVVALAGILAVGLYTAVRARRFGLATASVAAAAATILVFSQGRGQEVMEAFRNVPGAFNGGELGRWPIWTQAAGMVPAFPLWGVGLGAFQYVFPGFRTGGPGVFLSHAHNDYLELLVETGVVGALAFGAGLFLVIFSAFRRREGRSDFGPFGPAAGAGVLVVALHALVDFSLAIPAVALTCAILAGLFLAWRRPAAPEPAAGGTPGRSWLPAMAAPAAGMALVAVVAAAPVLAGSAEGPGRESPDRLESARDPRGGSRLARVLDGDNAERLFTAAAARGREATERLEALHRALLEGQEPPPEAVEAVVGELQAALELQEEGIRRAPTYPRGHLYRGHLRAAHCAARSLMAGGGEECVRAGARDFTRALQLNPMSAATHAKVARFYLRAWPLLDRPARVEALRIIEKAARMNWADEDLKRAAWTAREEVSG